MLLYYYVSVYEPELILLVGNLTFLQKFPNTYSKPDHFKNTKNKKESWINNLSKTAC